MAQIIGAIATSHTPTIGFAANKNQKDDPVWRPIFDAYEPVRAWLVEKKPDALFIVYNDHTTSFFFDHCSAFTLGIGDHYAMADEGGGARDVPPPWSDTPRWRATSASRWCRKNSTWPSSRTKHWTKAAFRPCPCCAAKVTRGQALRRAVGSYPQDLKIVTVATGGLSHQVHGERSGFNNIPETSVSSR